MQSSSADTQYTFGDNIVAVAESGGHQSSPATGEESGAASGTWHNLSSRRSRSSASQRQTGRTSRRSTPRGEQGLRTPKRPSTRSGTPRSTSDRHSRTRDVSGKRRSSGPEHFSLNQAAREELLEYQGEFHEEVNANQELTEHIHTLENEVMSRNQVISDIEVKFTEYLRGYQHTVNTEVETLSVMLSRSTNEICEYQAELLVAAQDDEGSTMRIEELDRRANLSESVAKRIFDEGMIMREEYQDQVQHLQALLTQTEDRVRQMESGSEYAQSLVNHLHSESTEMQKNMEHAIMTVRQQNQIALSSNADLQIMSRRAHDELNDSNSEITELRRHLDIALRGNKNHEDQIKRVVHESRLKVSEANQRCLDSEHKYRILRNETDSKNEKDKALEAKYVADNMIKDQQMTEMKDEIMRLDKRLKESVMHSSEDGHTFGSHSPVHPMIENLESELRIQELTKNDLVEEASEYVKDNMQLKDEVTEMKARMKHLSTDTSLDKFKAKLIEDFESELTIERKSHLRALGEKDTKIWGLMKAKDDQRVLLNGKDGEISRLRSKLQIVESENEEYLSKLPFSAGMIQDGHPTLVHDLRMELDKEREQHAITKAYYHQVDDAYTQEAEELAAMMKKSQGTSEQKAENKPSEKSKEEKTGKPRSFSPPEKKVPGKHPGPPGPPGDDPPDPDGPPGLPPSWRGSTFDDNMSQSNVTVAEVPRVSRREADKITVGAWPKVQDVETWKSDVTKSVTLAANDRDRAAWQEWLRPALADNPDLDALNDSGGPSFQSIDTKLSIALTNVINQAGEAGRDVQMQLRHRTQVAGRNASFVMGREILAMILSHFKTPGLRNTLFTMEHLYKMQYFGDSQLDQFYHRWLEMNNNMLPDDIPPDNWLRDSLYRKIRNSHLMMFDIKQYESWDDDDARKTYRHLRNVIERTIARVKEDKQTNARDKYARDYAGSGKPTIPAPTTPTPKAGNDAAPAPKAKEKATPKPKPKADAAPVLPSPQPKRHAKGKGKGKGTPRSNSRSASPSPKEKKKIPCHYHFVKNSCKHGKDCLFSHDPKVFENYKKGGGKGKGKSKSPRKRTPSNPPKKIDEPCWNWDKGKCKYGDSCRRRHDPHLFNTAPNTSSPAAPALVHDFDSDSDETTCFKAASITRTSERKVRFDMKKIDQVEYTKEDFVQCLGRAPRHKPHNKVGKSTSELKQDEQLSYSNRLAVVRARAMAFYPE